MSQRRSTRRNVKVSYCENDDLVDTTYEWSLRKTNKVLYVGDRVEAKWKGQSWYPGTIIKIDKSSRPHKHSVQYDDGDMENDVLKKHIKLLEGPDTTTNMNEKVEVSI